MKLSIGQDLAERIGKHGAETYPHECCGALLGTDADDGTRQVRELFRLVNRQEDSPRNRFMVTSTDVIDAEKAGRLAGLDVVGWYHSHPDHPARPSEFDREHAWPWYSYIIVSVQGGQAKDITSWRLNDDRTEYTEEEISVSRNAQV
jgi:proteasome lid subunit RPN8/RPN11